MKCLNCKAEIKAKKFCPECGFKLPDYEKLDWLENQLLGIAQGKIKQITCYNCGKKLSASKYPADAPMARACTECGALLKVPFEIVELISQWGWIDTPYLGSKLSWMTPKQAQKKVDSLEIMVEHAKKKVVDRIVKKIERNRA